MYDISPDILDVCKALGENTRFAIFRQIAGSDTPLTVKDLVAAFGMHHSAIRIHLNRLEEAGLIVSQKRSSRGTVGRPRLAFLPNPTAVSITFPPRNYELLARLAMDFAGRRDSERQAAIDFATTWGRDLVHGRHKGEDGRILWTEALQVLQQELRALGMSPQAAKSNGQGSYIIVNRNCLFRDLARDHEPFICQVHQSLMRGMLQGVYEGDIVWTHESSLAGGDERCLIQLRPANATELG